MEIGGGVEFKVEQILCSNVSDVSGTFRKHIMYAMPKFSAINISYSHRTGLILYLQCSNIVFA